MFDKEKIDLIIKNNWNLKTAEIAELLNQAKLKTEHDKLWTQPHVSKYANKFLSLRKKAEHTRDHSKEENISESVVGEIVAEEIKEKELVKINDSNLVLKTVQFNGVGLVGVQLSDNRIFTPVKKICDDLGIDSNAQIQRIKRDDLLSEGGCIIHVPSSKGIQETFCLDIDYLPSFLTGIQISKCRPEVQPILKDFKLKAKDLLAAAFINKEPVQQPQQILSDSERLLLQAQINVEHEKAIKQIDSNVSKVQEEVSSLRKTVETVIINFKPRRERNYNPNYKQASLFPTDENASKFDQIKSQVTQYSTLTNRSESSIYTMLYGIYDSEIFKRTGIRSNIKLEREKYNESQKSKNELSVIKYVDKFGDINLLHKITFNNIGFDNLGSASNG